MGINNEVWPPAFLLAKKMSDSGPKNFRILDLDPSIARDLAHLA